MRFNSLYFLLFFLSASYAQQSVYDVARSGCTDDIEQIIKNYPEAINLKNTNGHTPLILACYSGNKEVVEVLIEHVKNINAVSDNGTALMAATFKGNIEISRLLLEHGADVNTADLNGNTALHYAVRFTNIGIIKLLMIYNADVNLLDIEGLSPFDYAKRDKGDNIIRLLNKVE